jgi:chemotaxis protein methyltransferase CheR
VLEEELNSRLKLHRMKDFREYYRLLLYDKKNRDDEIQAIMDILTVNETYFFREKYQLKAFSEEILPELREKNKDKKRISIWSAACSTGEEPYTIAMLILEDGGFNGWDISILASDISQRALHVARRGVYKKNSFRDTSQYFIKKYFHEQESGEQRITDRVRRFVNFSFLNLVDSNKVKLVGPMDVIFCRNVLIYFDWTTREKVVKNLFEALKEGGYLLLGHTESLINLSTNFTLKHFKNDIVYQRPYRQKITLRGISRGNA